MVFSLIELSRQKPNTLLNELHFKFPFGRYIFHGQLWICGINDLHAQLKRVHFVGKGVHSHQVLAQNIKPIHNPERTSDDVIPKYFVKFWDDSTSHEKNNINVYNMDSESVAFIPHHMTFIEHCCKDLKIFALVSKTTETVDLDDGKKTQKQFCGDNKSINKEHFFPLCTNNEATEIIEHEDKKTLDCKCTSTNSSFCINVNAPCTNNHKLSFSFKMHDAEPCL